MSCDCGCCPKCGCRATCTCNQNLWSLESGAGDFSYSFARTVADELDGQYNFNGDHENYSSHSGFSVAGENGETCSMEGIQHRSGAQQQQVGSQWQ